MTTIQNKDNMVSESLNLIKSAVSQNKLFKIAVPLILEQIDCRFTSQYEEISVL
ncbi:hypothetical protein Syun_028801 [Stephania yunnanensis]|uniref:Uncharacterized protein n=1 Tax=Stephania yunnanensis TaxID=152371 RepID=A0AAP0E7S4_9MAGN